MKCLKVGKDIISICQITCLKQIRKTEESNAFGAILDRGWGMSKKKYKYCIQIWSKYEPDPVEEIFLYEAPSGPIKIAGSWYKIVYEKKDTDD